MDTELVVLNRVRKYLATHIERRISVLDKWDDYDQVWELQQVLHRVKRMSRRDIGLKWVTDGEEPPE